MTEAAAAARDAFHELRLARTARVGPATHLALMRRFGSAEAALEALPALAAAAGGAQPRIPSADVVEAELAAGHALGATLLRLSERRYPALLREIDPPPPVLWAVGALDRLTPRAVALVGSRNASPNGEALAASWAETLSAAGLLVVSGFARGVDRAAHEGALAAAGGTASVLAGGVDHIYPPEHVALYARIKENGALVSEMPIGQEPTPTLFRRRNRLISGLALGVVVVEARARSGSLITATAAVDQGRDVMAAPGHPFDARSDGCNRLIREGAILVRSADDVLEALSPRLDAPPPAFADPYALNEDDAPYSAPMSQAEAERLRAAILARLTAAPQPIDRVLRGLQVAYPAALWALTELEVAGLALREPGGVVTLAPPR